jgi:cytochrome c biogenesis protein CcdA
MQVELSHWLSHLAGLLPFGYSFGAGMVSAVNPCGFALLPVYLSLYLGGKDHDFQRKSLLFRLARSFWISLVVTAGFGLLFGLVGAVVSAGGTFLMKAMPWLAVIVGLALMVLGIWILLGHTVTVYSIQNLANKLGDPRKISVLGYFLFGLAFAATSLGCTLPIFLMVVGSSAAAGGFSGGLMHFAGYILGMGSVMQLITLGIALVKERLVVGALRRLLPYVQKLSGLLLLGAGGYILHYWFTSGLLFD